MLDKKDIEIIKNVVETVVDERLEKRLDERLQPLENDVKDIKRDVENVKQDVEELKQEVKTVKQDVEELKQDVEVVKQDVEKTKYDVIKINLLLENDVMPRLNTIEACYTSTYRRYADGIEQLETMQTDIDILKETAAQHAGKFQRLL